MSTFSYLSSQLFLISLNCNWLCQIWIKYVHPYLDKIVEKLVFVSSNPNWDDWLVLFQTFSSRQFTQSKSNYIAFNYRWSWSLIQILTRFSKICNNISIENSVFSSSYKLRWWYWTAIIKTNLVTQSKLKIYNY